VTLSLLAEPTEEIKEFRLAPWPFQRTFKTPLKDLNRFVATFLRPFSLGGGVLDTDQVVFEPKSIRAFLATNSVTLQDLYHFTLRTREQQEIANVLQTVLSDWVDFAFVSSPPVLAIYADHDEYTTFYARQESKLNELVTALETAGFKVVSAYVRGGASDGWR